jgi:hypothetical protein
MQINTLKIIDATDVENQRIFRHKELINFSLIVFLPVTGPNLITAACYHTLPFLSKKVHYSHIKPTLIHNVVD